MGPKILRANAQITTETEHFTKTQLMKFLPALFGRNGTTTHTHTQEQKGKHKGAPKDR